MAASAPSSASEDVFTVYMPYAPHALCSPFIISREDRVEVLKQRIRLYPDLQKHIGTETVYLLKSDLPVSTQVSRYKDVIDLIRLTEMREAMEPVKRLKEYFPDGPASESDMKIDIIAVTDSIFDSLRSSTPENKFRSPHDIERTPRKNKESTEADITKFLRDLSARLREYLAGAPWRDFWEAPPSADEQTRKFINDLKIPEVGLNPSLLLHDLGSGVVDSAIVDRLFKGDSKYLVNTSGSGKTRLLFEGLIKHWGFYFTTKSDDQNQWLGSRDVMEAIDKHIPNSRGFTKEPRKLPNKYWDDGFDLNGQIAERRFCQLLAARRYVFGWFLETAAKAFPRRSINEFKQHWLFLQLQPFAFLGCDVFSEVSGILNDASNEALMKDHGEFQKSLIALQREFDLGKDFFLVLDEAQVAVKNLPRSFRSEQDGAGAVDRPVLKPIIKTWKYATHFPIIISGTGLSLEVVNEVVQSAVGKPETFVPFTDTGAFDDQDRQRKYILRYMPSHIAKTDSGMALLNRAWKYAHGRHRFTAELTAQLIKFSFQSPHKLLNEYIKRYCEFFPSDGQEFVEAEEDLTADCIESFSRIKLLNFLPILSNKDLCHEIRNILYAWILLRTKIAVIKVNRDLVELGFAHFDRFEEAYIDEPIVLLSAVNMFKKNSDSLDFYVKERLQTDPGRGEHFEWFIGYYFSCVFDGKRRLCDIFDFGEKPPKFAEQPAELVSVAFTPDGVEANRFNLLTSEGDTSAIGYKSHVMGTTMKWLRNPWTLMCFPDNLMGPDIVCFLRVAGVILVMITQCKWFSNETLNKRTLESAKESISVTKIYQKQNLKRENAQAGKKCAFDLFNSVNGKDVNFEDMADMEWGEWLQDGMPVLRVIASYPAETPESVKEPYYAVVNMEKLEQNIKAKGFFQRVAKLLGVKRAADEEPEPEKPIEPKKPRVEADSTE